MPETGNAQISAARRLMDGGKLIEARTALNTLLSGTLRPAEQAEVRGLLTKLSNDTVFSKQIAANDPLIEIYTVQSGDNLIKIARSYTVPSEALMLVNGITDAGRLRIGQKLKIPRGPFNLRIYLAQFRMDVYLQDTYVRSYPVGLGVDRGTPLGVWRVKERLMNPTYYPPASATDKRVIAPGDPNNPLGERWIGLEGLEGAAVGQSGFGIHGTIEPDSIGKAVSHGCIRMHNEDVALVYQLMKPGKSKVTTLP